MTKDKKIAAQTDLLVEHFGLKKQIGGNLLSEWLGASGELTAWQSELLDMVYLRSLNHIRGWNEEELKMKLLSFLFLISEVEVEDRISLFFERSMSASIDGKNLSVTCDCLIASPLGYNTPKTPYFFLQEFKKEKEHSSDPEGQMLAAMLIAQAMNQNEQPVYGAWLTGSTWIFTVLQGKQYFFSNNFDATDKSDLLKIVFIIRKLKMLV